MNNSRYDWVLLIAIKGRAAAHNPRMRRTDQRPHLGFVTLAKLCGGIGVTNEESTTRLIGAIVF
jgi:hypothetical protein